MSNQTIRTPETRAKFLHLLGELGNVTAAALGAGIGRTAAYSWRNEDASFCAAWDEAAELGISALEDIARARAAAGSDLLLCFLLRAARPERYRERQTIDVNQQVTVSDLRRLPREELLRQLNELRARQDGDRLLIEGSVASDTSGDG